MYEAQNESRRTGPSTWAIVAGAATGAAAIYMLRTAEGRKLLDSAIRLLEDFTRTLWQVSVDGSEVEAAIDQGNVLAELTRSLGDATAIDAQRSDGKCCKLSRAGVQDSRSGVY